MPNPDDEAHAMFEAMLASPEIQSALDEATDVESVKRALDPEMQRPRHIHMHSIIANFVFGVVTADAFYFGYTLPEGIHEVVGGVSAALIVKFGREEVIHTSLYDIGAILRGVVEASPICKAWNDRPGSPVCSRYSTAGDSPEFIDLGALVQNGMLALQRQSDRDEAFDRDFDERWAREHPPEAR